jgi:hypothetical protein
VRCEELDEEYFDDRADATAAEGEVLDGSFLDGVCDILEYQERYAVPRLHAADDGGEVFSDELAADRFRDEVDEDDVVPNAAE